MAFFVVFISWIIFSTLMSIFIENKWLIFLWIPLGYVVAMTVFIFFVFVMLQTYFRKGEQNPKINVSFTRSTARLLNFFIFKIKIHQEGYDNVPLTGKTLCYANHRSKVDPLILLSIFKRPSGYTPKDTLYKVTILRLWFERLGSMKIHRNNDRETAREMVRAIGRIKKGLMMVIYPEGTTKNHETETIENVRLGSYKLALKGEADIIPVSIFGAHAIKDNFPWRKSRIYVKFHEPIKYESIQNMNTQAVDTIVQSKINEGIKELQQRYGNKVRQMKE